MNTSMMRRLTHVIFSAGLITLLLTVTAPAVTFYYSVDIGGDYEWCDPTPDGNEDMDPAWIYTSAAGGYENVKTDILIWDGNPPPNSEQTVPYEDGSPEDAEFFFDIDGEDQLGIIPGQDYPLSDPVTMDALPESGLFHNPRRLYYSLDDDAPPGWWAIDVPVTIMPDFGGATNEILTALGWRTWPVNGTPAADEVALGMPANPLPQEQDDDVDALDTRWLRYWFWTCDHEAHMGLDPGSIYLTDTQSSGQTLYIPGTLLGLPPGTDLDAFEFCVTDDADLIDHFSLTPGSYLAVIFSVDQDDPTTLLPIDESGGLNPKAIYISLLKPGISPYIVSEHEDDVDAIALEEEEEEPPPDPSKWIQLPDLTTTGVDVCGTVPILLADDFLCTTNQLITNIVIWASWKNDELPEEGPDSVEFVLSFHLDIPKEGPGDYSKPLDPPIWMHSFPAGSYTVEIEMGDIKEWWYNPETGLSVFPGDTNCWKYTFPVPVEEAFEQLGSPDETIVYWLDAQMISEQDAEWGWKSSLDHWNDDAVWAFGLENDHGPWQELHYAQNHPMAGESIDLAFALYGGDIPEEELIDFGDAPDRPYCTYAANNGARHLIVSGGPWMGDATDAPDGELDGQPTVGADGDNNSGLRNDENGVVIPAVIRQSAAAVIVVTASQSCRLNAWIDFNADGDWADAGEQIANDTALSSGDTAINITVPMGAVVGRSYARFRVSSAGGDGTTGLANDGEVEDYTIEIGEKFPPALGLKWRQPPDCRFGLNLESWMAVDMQGLIVESPVVADDWWCDGRPINAIRWWGSYILYDGPPNDPAVIRPREFRLCWYLDIPATADGTMHSRPGPMLKQTTLPLIPYGMPAQNKDEVTEIYKCTVPLEFLGSGFEDLREHKYEYNVVLDDPWMEKNTLKRDHYEPDPCSRDVYWISIEAVYDTPPDAGNYIWGWETTPKRFNWNDAAVLATNTSLGLTAWTDMTYLPPLWPWVTATQHPYLGEPVNMAFAMLSEVVGRRDVKWQQLPNMVEGTDMPSWRYDSLISVPPWAEITLRADDFISDGRRITDIHWWGSYIGWQSDIYADEFDPVVAPLAVNERPLGFDLSWHKHDVNIGVPGILITNIFIPMDRCHEMYYCTIPQAGHPTYLYEHEYQYYVDLLDEQLDTLPWNEVEGEHYWLNIQAVFDNRFVPAPSEGAGLISPHEGWGWKIAGVDEKVNLFYSVVQTNFVSGTWDVSVLPFWHMANGLPHDLSFELTTDQPNANAVIEITSIQRATNALATVTSRGTGWAGVQVLQRCAALKPTPAWMNVMTNEVPFPPLALNTWLRFPSPNTNEFYRVIEFTP